MSGFETAQERLESAISRLESAYEGYCGRLEVRVNQLESEANKASDVDDLMRALDEAQRDNVRLSDANEAAVERVDRVVTRLRGLLGTGDESKS